MAVQPAPPVEGGTLAKPFGVMFSSVAAYKAALSEVCLPLISEKRPLADIERDARLVRVGPAIAHATAADRVYRLPTVGIALAVAWADGTCSVTAADGQPADYLAAAAEVLSRRPERFTPGLRDVTSIGQDRLIYCAADRPHPVLVTVTTRGARSPKLNTVSTTVFRSNYDDPPNCAR